jgi:hypothetical protein
VLRLENLGLGKRHNVFMSTPESVMQRVHERLKPRSKNVAKPSPGVGIVPDV